MLSPRTVVELLAIVVVLVMAPSESATLKMSTRPSDWYGEFVLSTNREINIISKNSGAKPVTLSLSAVKQNIVKGFDETVAIDSKVLATVPGESYSLVSLDRTARNLDELNTRYVTGDNALPFPPGPLAIYTRSDSDDTLVLFLLVLASFVGLSYFVGVYCHERSVVFEGKLSE
jgi:hypothetical protein